MYRCEDSREVMGIIAREPIGLVLLDLTMPHLSGETLLQQIVEEYPEIAVIIISGLNQLETAVNCIRLGAYDYFVKTTEEDRLIGGIRRAIASQEMRLENQEMRRRFRPIPWSAPRCLPASLLRTRACARCFSTWRRFPPAASRC
ncbi:response regulator [Oceanimonas sp. NS1]|nr:response regulator [Oceanimonas sp. NS1]